MRPRALRIIGRLTDIAKTARRKLGLSLGGGWVHDEFGASAACRRAGGTTRAGHCATIRALR